MTGVKGIRFKDCKEFRKKHGITDERIKKLGLIPFFANGFHRGYYQEGKIKNLPTTYKIITIEQLNEYEKEFNEAKLKQPQKQSTKRDWHKEPINKNVILI